MKKKNDIPVEKRYYRCRFTDIKAIPWEWAGNFLYGLDPQNANRLIDLKRIGPKVLAELHEKLPQFVKRVETIPAKKARKGYLRREAR